MTAETGIGARVRRKEDVRFITGRGRYTDGINRPGQLHAVFARSPDVHARIRSLDTSGAEASPGIVTDAIGVRTLDMPATPLKVWTALQAGNAAAKGS
jgi:CO/xanthine dehydrogenase Mo-binding subunit